jgi:cysteine dioxygenase
MQPLPLLALCTELSREFQRDPKGAVVAAELARYATAHADWRAWTMFDAQCYTRNLVHHETHYELLLLCWGAGQRTPIHNHQGQRCWMSVLEGEIVETQFAFPAAGGGQPLAKAGLPRKFVPGQVAFITDDIALHEIAASEERPAVSLHLYSRPFSSCQVYDRETGRVELRQLGYYSVRGQRELISRPTR